ncbi:MAG TPA: hypothetical protein VG329_05310 [Candidatus Dormibacteraeota bacterium]|nr:hypothetical protein [Candidatus Dormibacteraeota bacterium]
MAGGATRTAAIAALLTLTLAACGGSSSNNSGSGGGGSNYGYTVPKSSNTQPASPSPEPQTAAPAPPQAAAPAPAGAPVQAMAMSGAPLTFALMPVAGVTGSVTVQPMGASMFALTVSARGMAPGSTHAVHIHFGNCPSAGVHIVALAPVTANGMGAGTSTTTVHMAYKGDGRFLIVYAGPNPGPLAACAQLAG